MATVERQSPVDEIVGIYRLMDADTKQIIGDAIMSLFVLTIVLELQRGAQVGIVTIGFINAFRFKDFFGAYRQYKRNQRRSEEMQEHR